MQGYTLYHILLGNSGTPLLGLSLIAGGSSSVSPEKVSAIMCALFLFLLLS